MQIPKELSEISSHITDMMKNSDCFNTVVEEGKLEVVMCLQSMSVEYKQSTGHDLLPKMVEEIMVLASQDEEIAWSVKYSPPDFVFLSVASPQQSVLLEIAQIVLILISEIKDDDKMPEE